MRPCVTFFCVWFISLNVMSSRFIHDFANDSIPVFLKYSTTTPLCGSTPNNSSYTMHALIDSVSACCGHAAMSWECRFSSTHEINTQISFLLRIHPEVAFVDASIVLAVSDFQNPAIQQEHGLSDKRTTSWCLWCLSQPKSLPSNPFHSQPVRSVTWGETDELLPLLEASEARGKNFEVTSYSGSLSFHCD